MILVMTGTEKFPFDRLVRAVDELQGEATLGEDFFVQLGHCRYVPVNARYERFLPFGDICEAIRSASVVVTHAGAGSTLVCVQQGKHPVIVPRRSSLGEHVDDHQVLFAERLGEARLATVVRDVADLRESIRAARSLGGTGEAPGAAGRAEELTTWLESFWRGVEPALVREPRTER